jgi:hypothetical protein
MAEGARLRELLCRGLGLFLAPCSGSAATSFGTDCASVLITKAQRCLSRLHPHAPCPLLLPSGRRRREAETLKLKLKLELAREESCAGLRPRSRSSSHPAIRPYRLASRLRSSFCPPSQRHHPAPAPASSTPAARASCVSLSRLPCLHTHTHAHAHRPHPAISYTRPRRLLSTRRREDSCR